jgi:phospholipid/cholesterol/gamma-HCH transport system substrate-binding protein
MTRDAGVRLVRTGAFVTVALGLLFSALFLLGRSQALFVHRARLHSWFDNASGLVVGAPVRLGGVDVGIVESIRFSPALRERKVHVTLAVDRRYLDRIRADSIARLSSKGLLGDMLINISVGSVEAAPLADGATLAAQEEQGLTEVLATLQDGIGEIRALATTARSRLDAVLTDQLGRDVGRIANATADVAEHIEHGDGLVHALVYDPALGRKGARLLDDAQQIARHVDGAVGHVDALLGEVEHGSGTLHGLLYRDDGARLFAQLGRTVERLDAVIAEVRDGQGLLHELVYEKDRGELLANLTALSRTLKQIGDEVHQGKGTIGGLLEDPSIYEDLHTIVGNVKRNNLMRAIIRYTIKSDGLRARPNPR